MHEAGLGKVMSGMETAPAALTAGASEEDITAHAVSINTFKEKKEQAVHSNTFSDVGLRRRIF